MSRIDKLNRFYKSYFTGCAELAIAPYSLTFELVAGTKWTNADFDEALWGAGVCAFFTFAIPILPALTEITFDLAVLGVVFGVITAIVAYPIAFLIDLIAPQDQYQFRATYDNTQAPVYPGPNSDYASAYNPPFNPESDEYQGYPSFTV